MVDLFHPIVPKDKLDRNFQIVQESIGFSSARESVNEVFNSTKPIDKHFVQQFQTTGFDARIWELNLLAIFQELKFEINRDHDRPDFELHKEGRKYFVEAVTTHSSYNQELVDKMKVLETLKDEDYLKFILELRDENTIRLAGSLFNKLREQYWSLDWVKGNPIILAIEPFHHSLIHWLSDSNLVSYLYGIKHDWHHDIFGDLHISTSQMKTHKSKKKVIPSNFFNLDGSEYISAVMFSNSGTISKFNRIGKLKGYGDSNVILIRMGQMYDKDPNASIPIQFIYTVGQNGPNEDWSQGISMYHNPNAKYPLDQRLFPNFLHGFNDHGFYAYVPDFFPIQSETQILMPITD